MINPENKVGKLTNLELSNSIKNFIKDIFDNEIKSVLNENNKTINELKDTITELHNEIKLLKKEKSNISVDSNIKYSDIVTKNIEKTIINTLNETVQSNMEKIECDKIKKSSLIIYNVNEKNFNTKIEKNKSETKTVNEIINILTGDNIIKPIKIHRIGTFNSNINKNRPLKITLNTENEKLNILSNTFKLSNSQFNKIGISNEYTSIQLEQRNELINEIKEKNKLSDVTKYKIRFINENFKIIKYNIMSSNKND